MPLGQTMHRLRCLTPRETTPGHNELAEPLGSKPTRRRHLFPCGLAILTWTPYETRIV